MVYIIGIRVETMQGVVRGVRAQHDAAYPYRCTVPLDDHAAHGRSMTPALSLRRSLSRGPREVNPFKTAVP